MNTPAAAAPGPHDGAALERQVAARSAVPTSPAGGAGHDLISVRTLSESG
ncbi:hypothetical protein [Streptomyces tendae]